MKTNIKFTLAALVLITSCMVLPRETKAQQPYVSFQLFYDELSPYGEWIDYSNYGYVWIPDVSYDFTPYSTDGRWIMTDYGWTWASDYNWGWAAFHYGRWSYNDYLGWFWVPDNEWGPAWVNWRQYNGYYGWEPMQPGISLSISFGHQYNRSYDHWIFVRDRDLDRNDIHNYYVSGNERNRIVQNSVIIRNTYVDNKRHTTYVSGPSRTEFRRNTGRTIVPVRIRENSRPGSDMNNGHLQIYRPQVSKSNQGNRKPVPVNVKNSNDVKRRTSGNGSSEHQEIHINTNRNPEQNRNINKVENKTNRSVQRPARNQKSENATPLERGTKVDQQENQRVQSEKNVSPGNSDRNIKQDRTLDKNQPNTNRVKRTRTVNPKGDKPESTDRKSKKNENRDK